LLFAVALVLPSDAQIVIVSHGWLTIPHFRPGSIDLGQCIRISYDTIPATNSPTMASIRVPSNTSWDTSNISHTVIYAELNAGRFNALWQD
jgi:hypothetical protein